MSRGRSSTRSEALSAQLGTLVRAIRENDDASVEAAVLALSQKRRLYAPLAFVVGALIMLLDGLRLLVTNWRLTLVQVLPAMWVWLAMLDLKAHVLRGKSFHVLTGPVLVPLVLAVTAITAASFYLNAVFAFAIATPGPPEIRPAFSLTRVHARTILGWGALVGFALGLSSLVVTRWGALWFGLSMSVVVGILMLCYVTIPSRLLGVTSKGALSRRDKVAATAMGGALGAIICTPPYAIGRLGLLMLGSRALFVPGVILLTVGLTLQAGATGSVKAIKMSTKLRAPSAAGERD